MPQRDYFDYPESTCPKCHRALNSLAIDRRAPRDRPRPGDFTICFYCGSILVFREDSQLDLPTLTERLEIANDRDLFLAIRDAQQKVLLAMQSRGSKS